MKKPRKRYGGWQVNYRLGKDGDEKFIVVVAHSPETAKQNALAHIAETRTHVTIINCVRL